MMRGMMSSGQARSIEPSSWWYTVNSDAHDLDGEFRSLLAYARSPRCQALRDGE